MMDVGHFLEAHGGKREKRKAQVEGEREREKGIERILLIVKFQEDSH